jgi:hypothetical protein
MARYNDAMTATSEHYVESLPADLDRFLDNFFAKKGWRSEIEYDAAAARLCLRLKVADMRLSADDRFFSLVEYYVRAQRIFLRANGGVQLQCRLTAADGTDLTPQLQSRGATHLDDAARGSQMRRRLAWLGFRRHFARRLLPGSLLWAAAISLLVLVLDIPLPVTMLLCFTAVLVQAAVIQFTAMRRR